MPLDLATFLTLSASCAPAVAPTTLLAIAQVESGLDPLAIGVNGAPVAKVRARSTSEAIRQARALIAAGRDVDLGLAQINVRNLARVGLSLEQAFDPCRNLAASAAVLREGYQRAIDRGGSGQAALRTALSYYNTGHPDRGLRNGYVARVSAAAGRAVTPAPLDAASAAPAAPRLEPPAWDVFARGGTRLGATFVFSQTGATP